MCTGEPSLWDTSGHVAWLEGLLVMGDSCTSSRPVPVMVSSLVAVGLGGGGADAENGYGSKLVGARSGHVCVSLVQSVFV